jgi:hypothetical protein
MRGSKSRRRWVPVLQAIEFVANNNNTTAGEAWEAIKEEICRGELPATGITDKGERVDFAPHWIGFLAQFHAADNPQPRPVFCDPGDVLPVHESRDEIFQLTDFPEDNMVWFDRRKAIERRIKGDAPPRLTRDLVVDAVRLKQLHEHTCPIPPRETKLGAVQTYIARTYTQGLPAGVTDKVIAKATGVSERTVRRARKSGPSGDRKGQHH